VKCAGSLPEKSVREAAGNPASMPARRPDPVVRVHSVSKWFGGATALSGADLDIHGGSVLALLGPNGAGKSTLREGEVLDMVGLSGAGHMDLGRALVGSRPILDGRVLLDGRPYHPRTTAAAVTSGVDIGAKAEIYRLLGGALSEGLAVLLVSTDFEEVAGVCHRALVFVRGTETAELSGEGLTVTALTHGAFAMPALTGTEGYR
jgi:ABC-type sugar transport system ATPase subunit